MKTSKRIWLGLSAFLFLFTMVLSVLPAPRTLAAGSATSPNDVTNCVKNLRFVNISEVDCTFTPAGQATKTTVHFVDSVPTDGGSHHAYKMNYSQQDGFFCENGSVSPSTNNGGAFDRYYPIGVTHKGDGPLQMSDAGGSVKLVFDEGYGDPSTGKCQYPKGYNKDNLPNVTLSGSATKNISKVLAFSSDGSALQPFDNVNDSSFDTYSLAGGYTNGSTVAYTSSDFTPGTCSGQVILVDRSGSTANRFTLKSSSSGISGHPVLLDFLNKQSTSGCGINDGDTNFGLGGTFTVAGTPPSDATVKQAVAAGTDNTASTDSTSSSSDCGANSNGFSLAWAICPVLDASVSLANEFIGLFEDQLSFKVADLGSPNKAASGYNEVKGGWAVIRDVASSLIVIFMLVMVLSQAVSWGPFDAYTVKKLLPKLVIAIVVMQISWDLFTWIVGLFDDFGHGIANIMYLPFGGQSNMDLWHLLGNAHVSAWTLGGINYAVLIAGLLALKFAVLPAFLGLIFSALMALAFGLFTLVFRKILIIMLLMLSPLALVAWILPGTSSYWKMWRENFIKALSMFPLAMGLIAAGRIFAKVAGAQDGNGTFLNMIFVFVGFFGPLFILPKTFKWGGQAMQMAGNGIMKARDLANKYPQQYFKNRQQDWTNRNKARSQLRVAYGQGWNWRKPMSYVTTPLDKFGSHQWDPLLMGKDNKSSRRSKIMQYKEAGHKVEEEEQGLNDREAAFEENRLDKTRYNHDDLWQDKLNGHLRNYQRGGKVDRDELSDKEQDGYKKYSGEYMTEWIKKNRRQGESDESVQGRFNDSTRKLSYAERDFYAWKMDHADGTYEQFTKDDKAFGYKDYSGKMVEVHHPEDKFEKNAALNMLSKFGGPNHPEIVRYLYQEMAAGEDREREAREWMQDHVDFILKVYPQMLKGLSSTATAPSFVGMHQVGFRDELARLMWNVKTAETPEDKQKAQRTLSQMISNLKANMESTEKNGIETDIRVLMKAIADNDTDTIEKYFNSDIRKMKYGTKKLKDGTEQQIVDSQTKETHPPEVDAVNPDIRAALDANGDLTRIGQLLNKGGGYVSGREGGAQPPGDEAAEPTTPPDNSDDDSDDGGGGGGRLPVGRPGGLVGRPTIDGGGYGGTQTRSTTASAARPTETPAAATAAPAATALPTAAAAAPAAAVAPVAPVAAATPAPSNSVSTSTGNLGYRVGSAATPTPIVNVNIDHEAIGKAIADNMDLNINHEAIGESFANHMRDVLRHTTLKIEHPDGGTGTGSFDRRELGGSGSSAPSRQDSAAEPEEHGPESPGGTS